VQVQTSLSFNREPKSVRAARGALDVLDGQFPKARLYEASLCLSELVSNAVQHPDPGGEVGLSIELNEQRLRVEVTNHGGAFDPGRPTKGEERGWGLFIVDSLSDSWGAEAGERTVVWFEILRAPRDQLGQETNWKAGTSAPST
jgi:anti-sigma regulatory factor (Ser/Thr protein kinase)